MMSPQVFASWSHPEWGIAGLGTVGAEVIRLIEQQGPDFVGRVVDAACASSPSPRSFEGKKKRGPLLRGMYWARDPLTLASDAGIDCFVELMGGSGEPALSAIEAGAEGRAIGGHGQQGAERQTWLTAGGVLPRNTAAR